MQVDLNVIRDMARRELQAEAHRLAVEREKERLREQSSRSWWQRLLQKLPFTIQRKKSP